MNRRKKNRIGMRIFAVLMFIAVSCIGIEPEPTRPDAFSNTKETKQQIGKAVPNLEAGAVEETAASDAELVFEMPPETPEATETETPTEEISDPFSDAVFLGDSRTEGFVNLTDIHTTAYAYRGMNVASVYTDPVININGTNMTVMEALAGTSYNRVYLMFGVNETGWPNEGIFIEDYRRIIEDIKAQNPSAQIYIQSILPVSQTVSDSSAYIKNDRIRLYNELLQGLATEEQVTFINVAEAVSADGVLPEDAAVDGIHLKKEYCDKWLEYLRQYS